MQMFASATEWLEKSAHEIDALNVFPVPDGDTGANMLLTMRSTVEAAGRAADRTIAAVAKAMAKGALMGARGNSGVILSQIFLGIAQQWEGKAEAGAALLAEALARGSRKAYQGLVNPVEGTILTVMKDAAGATGKRVEGGETDIIAVLEAAVNAARESVANTPNLLPVLKESGVVDAGGQGLYTILDGALRYLKGEADQMKTRKPQIIVAEISAGAPPMLKPPEEPFGYSTEFILTGTGLNPDKIKDAINAWGRNIIVVGDEATVKVHIHASDPGPVLHFAVKLGTLHQISIRNMDEQYQDFLKMQRERLPAADIAVVAVASGSGMTDVFKSLGTTIVVPGGKTMNPSTRDLLQAVEAAPSDRVIVLPNDKNIIATANQLPALTKKQVRILPAKTVPQGVSALLALDYQAGLEANEKQMAEAAARVTTVEATRATRSVKLGDVEVKENEGIAFIDGQLAASGAGPVEALGAALAKLDLEAAEIVTLYYGADAAPAEASEFSEKLRREHPGLQVEVVNGGQPNYHYIASVE
ncbi:MAG: DAK2 domain-containing protein [Chloroflexi bacterium]|nr:DAK2 domain-containing protein [Chloroflexota bacterium]